MGENGGETMEEEWKSVVTNDNTLSNLRLNNNEFDKDKEGDDGEEEKERRVCSLAERRAAKYGFNAARFRSLGSPGGGGNPVPCLTIPPGISPTALLDSPIMLPNSQSSPTTGALPFPPLGHESSTVNSITHAADVDLECNSSFSFRPTGSPISLPFSGSENQGSSPCDFSQNSDADVDETLAPGQQSIDFEFPSELLQEIAPTKFCYDKLSDANISNTVNLNTNFRNFSTSQLNGHTSQQRDCLDGEAGSTDGPLQGVEKAIIPQMGLAKTSEDGYNWRKYGQKQVKGSEYPRSYYKCTHPSCPVKKKVERSHDGQITEIIYKGSHSHPKPLPNRRSALGTAYSFNEFPQMSEGSDSYSRIEGGSLWRNIQPGSRDTTDWRHDNIERASSTSVLTDLSDHISSHGKTGNIFGSAGLPNLSPTISSNDVDNDDDQVIQGNLSIGDDTEDDESDSKRRKTEACLIETNLGSRAVREPRVVVQIESDVDILDDGYRWRKYGQKVVKGNPNPRSYYKCTSAGCSVRKHVERASHNLKFVITTYEGKHNHEVPASRNSIHMNSNNANLPPTAPTAQSTHLLPRHATIPKTETHIQDFMPHFEQKPSFGNGFLRPNIPGNYSDMKFAPTIYPMKFPHIPYGSFGLNCNYTGVPQVGLRNSMVQDFPVPLPVTLSRLGEPGLGGFDFSNCGRSIGQVSFLESESMQFLSPKQEEKDEDIYDSGCQATASSSVYHQMMGRFAS